MPAGHKRLISTVAASTPNDRRVIPDLTPSGASVLVVSFLHGFFHTVQALDGVLLRFSTQICGDFAELFEGGFEVFDDFLGENVGIWEMI